MLFNVVPNVCTKRFWKNAVLAELRTIHGAFPLYFKRFKVKDTPQKRPFWAEDEAYSAQYLLNCRGTNHSEEKSVHGWNKKKDWAT